MKNVRLYHLMFFHQQLFSITRDTASNCLNLMLKKTVRSNFFSIRLINAWNQLPNEVVNSNSDTNFKILFDNYHLCDFCIEQDSQAYAFFPCMNNNK